jgi:hypothetical protein
MPSVTAWDMLAFWEQGYTESLPQKALRLLSLAWPDSPPDELAALSVGQRDGRLLALREQLFGPELQSVVNCPACGERLELAFQVTDIYVAGNDNSAQEFSFTQDGYTVRFRLPNSQDLMAVSSDTDRAMQERELLDRCLLEVKHARTESGRSVRRRSGRKKRGKQLPDKVAQAVIEQMAAADPQADVRLDLVCPACSHQWQPIFDIVSFIWQEIHSWAVRTLRQVHTLAAAYGWSERDILSMSPWRRQLYLQMVNG